MIEIYSEEDICTIYRNAKNNINKVKLLEELTLLSEDEIIRILNKNGYKVKKPKKSRRKFNDEDLFELYSQGLNNTEIARVVGCSECTVSNWLRRFNLVSNHKKSLREQANKNKNR